MAPGPERVSAELLKNGTEKLFTILTYVFEKCLNGHDIPEDIIPIHKKGSKLQYNNYRGIFVTSTISRVYGRLLRDFIEEEYRNYA